MSCVVLLHHCGYSSFLMALCHTGTCNPGTNGVCCCPSSVTFNTSLFHYCAKFKPAINNNMESALSILSELNFVPVLPCQINFRPKSFPEIKLLLVKESYIWFFLSCIFSLKLQTELLALFMPLGDTSVSHYHLKIVKEALL